MIDQNRQQQLHRQNDQNRDEPGQKRDPSLLHRDGREVCQKHRDHELHWLHLAQLALSHEADDDDENGV